MLSQDWVTKAGCNNNLSKTRRYSLNKQNISSHNCKAKKAGISRARSAKDELSHPKEEGHLQRSNHCFSWYLDPPPYRGKLFACSVPRVTEKFMLAFTKLIPPTNRIWKQPSKHLQLLFCQYSAAKGRIEGVFWLHPGLLNLNPNDAILHFQIHQDVIWPFFLRANTELSFTLWLFISSFLSHQKHINLCDTGTRLRQATQRPKH